MAAVIPIGYGQIILHVFSPAFVGIILSTLTFTISIHHTRQGNDAIVDCHTDFGLVDERTPEELVFDLFTDFPVRFPNPLVLKINIIDHI